MVFDKESPAALSRRKDGADHVRALVTSACHAVGLAYRETNYLTLRRGPYVVAAGLDESLSDAPHVLRGRFVDLFEAGLPVLESVELAPGSRHLLFDLDRAPSPPAVIASACKVLGADATPAGRSGSTRKGRRRSRRSSGSLCEPLPSRSRSIKSRYPRLRSLGCPDRNPVTPLPQRGERPLGGASLNPARPKAFRDQRSDRLTFLT